MRNVVFIWWFSSPHYSRQFTNQVWREISDLNSYGSVSTVSISLHPARSFSLSHLEFIFEHLFTKFPRIRWYRSCRHFWICNLLYGALRSLDANWASDTVSLTMCEILPLARQPLSGRIACNTRNRVRWFSGANVFFMLVKLLVNIKLGFQIENSRQPTSDESNESDEPRAFTLILEFLLVNFCCSRLQF